MCPTYDGLVLAGAPIGTDAFVNEELANHLSTWKRKIDVVTQLGATEPQMAFHLLGICTANLPSYLLRVIPTNVLAPYLASFDELLTTARLTILTPADHSVPPTHPDRLHRFALASALSTFHGGTGQIPASRRAPGAFLAATLNAVHHNADVRQHAAALLPALRQAYANVCTMDGVEAISLSHPLAGVLPPSPDLLLAADLDPQYQTTSKAQKAINGLVSTRQRDNFRSLVSNLPHSLAREKTHLFELTSRSQASRIFTCSLWHRDQRIEHLSFISYTRWLFCLPPLLFHLQAVPPPSSVSPDGQPLRRCMPCHHKGIVAYLDVSGCHVNCCWSTRGFITRKHSTFQLANRTLANETCTEYRHEVTAASALNGLVPDLLARAMFPKEATARDKARSLRLHELNAQANLPDTTPQRRAELTRELMDLISQSPANGKGLRLDAVVSDDLNVDLWIDFHVQHSVADTHLSSNHAWFVAEHKADCAVRSRADGLNNFTAVSSPSVLAAEHKKRKHYALLTAVGQTFSASGLLPKQPKFTPVVVTHLCQLGAGAFQLIERYSRNAQRSPALSPYVTGISSRETGTRVRRRAKDLFACSIAKGWGRPMAIAGGSYC